MYGSALKRIGPRTLLCLILGFCGLDGSAFAGADETVPPPPQPTGSTVPSDPVFTAQLLDGATLTGRVRQINPDGSLVLIAPGSVSRADARGVEHELERVVPAGRWLKLSRAGYPAGLRNEPGGLAGEAAPGSGSAAVPAAAEGALVLFPDGDRLNRSVIGPANDTSLDVHSYALGNLSIPLDALLGLILARTGRIGRGRCAARPGPHAAPND